MPVMPLAIDLYVCENAAVLRAAAGQLGADSAALVCAEGEPSVACFRLLQAAVTTGTRIHWHSDFDWPGVRATAAAIRRLGAAPWLMGADDYRARAARERRAAQGPGRRQPVGTPAGRADAGERPGGDRGTAAPRCWLTGCAGPALSAGRPACAEPRPAEPGRR